MTGIKYGRLLVISRAKNRGNKVYWNCQCDCGKKLELVASSIGRDGTRSCGCLRRDVTRIKCLTHGHTANGIRSREFNIWIGIRTRCLNKNNPSFKIYGGRGIKLCEEWERDFMAFYNYVGPCPSNKHSIDRINNDGNYEPGNVRWATSKEQVHNRSIRRIEDFSTEALTKELDRRKVRVLAISDAA